MLKIYIVEDDREEREYLEKIIADYMRFSYTDAKMEVSTHCPEYLLKNIDIESPALYFLDIGLGNEKIDGIQLATKLRLAHRGEQAFIVFITTHEKLCIRTLQCKTEPLDFIVKMEIDSLKSKVASCIMAAIERNEFFKSDKPKLRLILDSVIINVQLDDIIYLETTMVKHEIRLHTADRFIEYKEYGGMKAIIEKLDDRFFKVHKSYIINIKQISSFNPKARLITMQNGDRVLCARNMIKTVKNEV